MSNPYLLDRSIALCVDHRHRENGLVAPPPGISPGALFFMEVILGAVGCRPELSGPAAPATSLPAAFARRESGSPVRASRSCRARDRARQLSRRAAPAVSRGPVVLVFWR